MQAKTIYPRGSVRSEKATGKANRGRKGTSITIRISSPYVVHTEERWIKKMVHGYETH
jgi:hypothetical protein